MGAETPKQYLEVAGSTLIEHSLRALLRCPQVAGVVVALHADDNVAATLPVFGESRVRTVTGAAHRSGSVLAGLDDLASRADVRDWVLVHDAARPCLWQEDLERLLAAVLRNGTGGILAEPIRDTVKQSGAEDGRVHTLDRSQLWRAQTPQMFRIGELRRALREAGEQGREVTDEASAMELAGFPVQLVAGSASNLKVTVPEDLALAGWYLSRARGAEAE
jgi:2-C-methyl-D-erythritol 4-phosphate cytidylyltransferase